MRILLLLGTADPILSLSRHSIHYAPTTGPVPVYHFTRFQKPRLCTLERPRSRTYPRVGLRYAPALMTLVPEKKERAPQSGRRGTVLRISSAISTIDAPCGLGRTIEDYGYRMVEK